MTITYDPEVDAAYIRFLEGEHECTTLRISEEVAVNVAPGGKVVGIEVLDASRNLEIARGAPQVHLENLRVV